jgi:hypothetical protein
MLLPRRIGQRGGQPVDAVDPQVTAGQRGDAEGVQGLQGEIVGGGEVGMHGGPFFGRL